jgi:hypothetical protein
MSLQNARRVSTSIPTVGSSRKHQVGITGDCHREAEALRLAAGERLDWTCDEFAQA